MRGDTCLYTGGLASGFRSAGCRPDSTHDFRCQIRPENTASDWLTAPPLGSDLQTASYCYGRGLAEMTQIDDAPLSGRPPHVIVYFVRTMSDGAAKISPLGVARRFSDEYEAAMKMKHQPVGAAYLSETMKDIDVILFWTWEWHRGDQLPNTNPAPSFRGFEPWSRRISRSRSPCSEIFHADYGWASTSL
jgi:hypothetical protein